MNDNHVKCKKFENDTILFFVIIVILREWRLDSSPFFNEYSHIMYISF